MGVCVGEICTWCICYNRRSKTCWFLAFNVTCPNFDCLVTKCRVQTKEHHGTERHRKQVY